MVRARLFVLALVFMVSPVGTAVCEVVCGTPLHAAAHAETPTPVAAPEAEHAHHAHHAQHLPKGRSASAATVHKATVDPDADIWTAPGPACDPVTHAPARVRLSASAPHDSGAASTSTAFPVHHLAAVNANAFRVAADPPAPPLPSSVPLRI